MTLLSRASVRVALFASLAIVTGSWLLYGQDLSSGLPKFYFRVSGNQLDVGVDSNVTVHLRAQDGKAVKTVEARPDGSSQTTSFSRDGKRMYLVQDSFDGSATMTIFDNDKEKLTLKLGKDGTTDVKFLALPKEKESKVDTSTKNNNDDKPEAKSVDSSSVLKNK